MAKRFAYKVDREIIGSVTRSLSLARSLPDLARYARTHRNPFQKGIFPIILSI